jgi:hypothetical protein
VRVLGRRSANGEQARRGEGLDDPGDRFPGTNEIIDDDIGRSMDSYRPASPIEIMGIVLFLPNDG